jgi:large subunit ribosomal protein L30
MAEAQNGDAAAPKRIRIRQVRSTIGFNKAQAKVAQSLGLRRIGHSIEVRDTAETRGMMHKVRHLIEVVE